MPVVAITPDYKFPARDRVENYAGNQLVYVGWDHHLMFCAAFTYLIAPSATFAELRDGMLPKGFSLHPEYSKINWDSATWLLDGEPFTPQLDKSLQEQGIGHKSLLRFQTPELKGYQNAGV
ncbi:MAG: phenol hydroxylase subunit P4 [Pseudomonas sp.]|jgi:phenol hydroxylase P4 protein|nr:phenol hydroxylase subunit P4 [Pseudomonas sp.]